MVDQKAWKVKAPELSRQARNIFYKQAMLERLEASVRRGSCSEYRLIKCAYVSNGGNRWRD